MTTRDDRPGGRPETNGGPEALDRYLDTIARGHAPDAVPAGLDPDLANAVRAVRALDHPPGPDPAFVARLREDLTMATPTRATTPASIDPSPEAPTSIPSPRRRAGLRASRSEQTGGRPITSRQALVRSWNRRAWPVLELLAAAVLILGLVTVMTGGGSGWLPSILVSDDEHAARQSTPTTIDPDGAVAMAQGDAGRSGVMLGPGVDGQPDLRWRTEVAPQPTFYGFGQQTNWTPPLVADGVIITLERRYVTELDGTQWIGNLLFGRDINGNVRWSAVWDGLSAG